MWQRGLVALGNMSAVIAFYLFIFHQQHHNLFAIMFEGSCLGVSLAFLRLMMMLVLVFKKRQIKLSGIFDNFRPQVDRRVNVLPTGS